MKLSSEWIERLLGRAEAPAPLDRRAFEGQRLLVTGAGGSIGSELVATALTHGARQVIALDQSESGLHELMLSLADTDRPRVAPKLGSTTDRDLLRRIVDDGVNFVIHSAAHKYVPLLENNTRAALINNVEGTSTPALTCAESGDISFVCVSSDKAADPMNTLGATKRLAELVTRACHQAGSSSRFTGVRLPNVLGSNGSVLPLFLQQAQSGGPLTVTDSRATRYFISIREAAHQILQAALDPADGELVIPTTSNAISIQQMAKVIAGSFGLDDSKIIGAEPRPGDCLHERLVGERETESSDRSGRRCVRVTGTPKDFLENVLRVTNQARREDDIWAKEQIQLLLIRYDSQQDESRPTGVDPGEHEAVNCS